jgi:hypothetical protein
LGLLLWLLEEHPELGWVLLVAPAMMIVALALERRKQVKIALQYGKVLSSMFNGLGPTAVCVMHASSCEGASATTHSS